MDYWIEQARQRVIDAGFPRAAECLDGTPQGVARARQTLSRFEPCSMYEADMRSRAFAALPEIVERENGVLEFY